jgi:hypothetical protein
MAASRLAGNADIVMGQSPPGETCNKTDIGLPLRSEKARRSQYKHYLQQKQPTPWASANLLRV